MTQAISLSNLETTLEHNIHYSGVVETDFPTFQKRVLAADPQMYRDLYLGKIFIVRNAYPKDQILELRTAIHAFGQVTPTSFHQVNCRCPNFHTINDEVDKYKVLMRVHSYHFFSWNKEPVDIFSMFRDTLVLFETLSEQDPAEVLYNTTDDDLIVRLQIHHYPPGGGHTQMHTDPTVYVKVAMLVFLSKLGEDYKEGGLYFFDLFGEKYYPERDLEIGDLVVFYPKLAHGVDAIDTDREIDWNSDVGRWTLLFNNRPPA